jgi:hypothetical protein
LLGISCVACAPYLSFVPSGETPQRAAKAKDDVDVYFDLDEPKCMYIVVGAYDAEASFGTDTRIEAQIDNMREDAAQRGFDGLVAVRCAAPGTVGSESGHCTAKGYVCE